MMFERKDGHFGASMVLPTGLAFLQRILGAGAVPGEVYGVLGPDNYVSSTLLVKMATSGASHLANSLSNSAIHYYSFRYSLPHLQMDVISATTGISRTKLENIRHGLSDSEQGFTPDEHERYGAATRILNPHLRLFDMQQTSAILSDSTRVDAVADSIAANIAIDRDRSNMDVAAVFVDDAKEACGRQVDRSRAKDNFQLTKVLDSFATSVRRRIAEPFGCPIWIAQPLRAQLGKASPLSLPNHRDAMYSKKFTDSLTFTFAFGTRDRNGCHRFACVKCPPQSDPAQPIVVRVDRDIGQVVDVTDEVIVDYREQRLVGTAEYSTIDIDAATAEALDLHAHKIRVIDSAE